MAYSVDWHWLTGEKKNISSKNSGLSNDLHHRAEGN